MNLEVIESLLLSYTDKSDAQFLLDGFRFGFRIPIDRSKPLPVVDKFSIVPSSSNDCVRMLLQREFDAGRLDGPYEYPPFSPFVVSPVHAVPKDSGDFRLIHNLSYPLGDSINSRISDLDATVQYSSFDEALDMINSVGPNCLLAKFDIKSAFKLLPVAHEDWGLLGIYFDGLFYFEKCLSFGLRCSCLYFERFARFVKSLLCLRSGHRNWISYLDDFLIVVSCDEPDVMFNSLNSVKQLAHEINLPLATEKEEGPATCVKFLGFVIDTESGLVSLPQRKIDVILQEINVILTADKVSLLQIQSLAGRLSFAARVIVMSRPFIRALYMFQARFRLPYHKHRISAEIRDDLLMWKVILSDGFGPFRIFNRKFIPCYELQLYTDASKSFGGGVVFGNDWFYFKWPPHFADDKSISYLEFIPIVLSVFVFANRLTGIKLTLYTDNEALVAIISKKTSSDPFILSLLRKFVIQCVSLDLEIHASFVPGKENVLADKLSRGLLEQFFMLHPSPNSCPVVVSLDLFSKLGIF